MNRYLLLITLISNILCAQDFDFKQYSLELYYKHNTYRALHGSPKIEYDENLNEIARKQAVKMADAMKFSYSDSTYNGKTLGENFFYCNSLDGSICLKEYDVAGYWYLEYYDYCFSSKSFTKEVRNFITMVWKETTLFGCGYEYRNYYEAMDAYFIVCVYYPGPHPTNGPTAEEIEANLLDRTDGNKKADPC